MFRQRSLLVGLMALLVSCSQGVPPADVAVPDDQSDPDGPAETDTPDTPPPCTPPAAYDAPEWYHTAVGYEIFVRSFRDSDGDGIGDFAGIIEKLDHLNDGVPGEGDDLEVDLIWLMPINPSPSYHGYDVIDYRDVHADYGGMEGVLTLEDAVETLIGIEIVDEADKIDDMRRLARQKWEQRMKEIGIDVRESDEFKPAPQDIMEDGPDSNPMPEQQDDVE